MAAGLGFKTFTTGEVLTAADTNGYLMQGVLVFASAAARDAAITSPQEGQCCYLKDTDAVLTYSGSAWVGFDDSNAIQNTIVDAKGDLIGATAADTPARLAVGTNGQVLTADSTAATGLAWATSASGGMTLLSTTTLSGSTTTVSITPTGYTYLYFSINKMGFNSGTPLIIRLNGATAAQYCYNTRANDNSFSKGSSVTGISSVNNYQNSDSQYVWGQLTLPNATNKRPTVEATFYYNASANEGFGQTWGAYEGAVAAISSITFLASNGTSTFTNSPQLLIYGVK